MNAKSYLAKQSLAFALFLAIFLSSATPFVASARAESCVLEYERWSLALERAADGIGVRSGRFGELALQPSELFRLRATNASGETLEIASTSGWESTSIERSGDVVATRFDNPSGANGISVTLTGVCDRNGVSWRAAIENRSKEYSIIDASFPTPIVSAPTLNLLTPDRSGRVFIDVGKTGYNAGYDYPGFFASMQYFAFWGEKNGLYLGFHDRDGALKRFSIDVKEGVGRADAVFPAIGAGDVGNSFALPGEVRWQAFDGDWYDATQIYKEFVLNEAKWLPKKGRPDVAPQFKEIAYWICDHIPRPADGAPESDENGAWADAAIELKKRLDAPIADQVYNWHKIPFDVNYPHFLPARENFKPGAEKLRNAGVYVFPYINAVSWEMDDADEGYEMNFANTGIRGAALNPDGTPYFVRYPSLKANGEKTRLAPICPGYKEWTTIIENVVRDLEKSFPIDGVYFDQISAVAPIPCRSREHGHVPGGGSYWSDGYIELMTKINENKPENAFYYSETNAEVYASVFDGFLTWIWTTGDDVPAFPAIYAGYIQMIGRGAYGDTPDGDVFFRYHLAEGLLFGQQLGWLSSKVVYNDERMKFLEQVVKTRYEWTRIFNEGTLMRPPKIETDVEPVTSSGTTTRQVVAGVWKMDDGSKTVLFVVNVSTKPAKATLRLFPEEYGVDRPETMEFELEPTSVRVVEL